MALSVNYVARETSANLWRNRLMTLAAILTIAVSLSLVGVAMVLRQGVSNATVKWQHGVNVIVWFDPVAGGAQQATQQAITHEIVQIPFVRSCTYRSQSYDYNEALGVLGAAEAQSLSVDTTPASERCDLDDPRQAVAVARQFSGQPGVHNVSYPAQAIRNMEQVTHVLQWAFFALAVVLLVSATVLIVNTIRLAIFARRREVSVMKLVGATNWFIRVPFMTEGLVQGLMGAAVAVVSIVGIAMAIHGLANPYDPAGGNVWWQMRMSVWDTFSTSLFILVVGIVIGTLGSAMAVRRFLDA
jgi:cell division transport system permease protein